MRPADNDVTLVSVCDCNYDKLQRFQRQTLEHVCVIDIDECADVTHGCQQICKNSIGNFSCNCRRGFELNADGKTCDGKYCTVLALTHCIHNALTRALLWR